MIPELPVDLPATLRDHGQDGCRVTCQRFVMRAYLRSWAPTASAFSLSGLFTR